MLQVLICTTIISPLKRKRGDEVNQTHAEYAAELSDDQRRQDDIERACADAIPKMWEMSLEEMDCELRKAMRGRISKEHRAIIQVMLDVLDHIASTAPSYILD